jgi:hypothetical protein
MAYKLLFVWIEVNGIDEWTVLKLTLEAGMFFEVRVYKADGTLKQKISRTELSNQHWNNFEKIEGEIGLNSSGTKPVPGWVKTKLNLEFPSNLELDHQSFKG